MACFMTAYLITPVMFNRKLAESCLTPKITNITLACLVCLILISCVLFSATETSQTTRNRLCCHTPELTSNT